MKLFFKKIGIMLVPCILTILAIIAFDVLFDMSWNADYPTKDPLQPIAEIVYRGSIHAISRVLFGTVIAVWVFCSLMNWAKGKIAKMMERAAKQDIIRQVVADDDSNGDGDGDGSLTPEQEKRLARLEFASEFELDVTPINWHLTKRYVFAYIGNNTVFATLNLDRPGENPDNADNFWSNCDAFIHGFWVYERARNKGLGTCLLDSVEKLCENLNCKTVGLRCGDRESEPWVLEWYKRRGYEEKFQEGDGHYHFLVKQLSGKKDGEGKNGENQE